MRRRRRFLCISHSSVSIHAPARGATRLFCGSWRAPQFQSTHPRGVRQAAEVAGLADLRVSIHAPARGATRGDENGNRRIGGFNPRTREGCDASGLTFILFKGGFNPRTREGCDITGVVHSVDEVKFQSTHPRGVRLIRCPTSCSLGVFQSTHPRGVRQDEPIDSMAPWHVSIHAPARGATFSSHQTGTHTAVSIHAPARGATVDGGTAMMSYDVSIHAPARGATTEVAVENDVPAVFQSTHPRGVRRSYLLTIASRH